MHAYVVAGPNGAGKTTFAREFLPKYAHCREFLNADLLAAGISPFDPDAAALAAGRVLLTRMKELIQQCKDFGFETTLAGKMHERVFQSMRTRGYKLHLFFLWLPSVELAIDRVAHRVKDGGHNIREDVIRRRYDIGLRNLVNRYLPLFDSWFLFDNSSACPRTIACCESQNISVLDAEVYQQIRGKGE